MSKVSENSKGSENVLKQSIFLFGAKSESDKIKSVSQKAFSQTLSGLESNDLEEYIDIKPTALLDEELDITRSTTSVPNSTLEMTKSTFGKLSVLGTGGSPSKFGADVNQSPFTSIARSTFEKNSLFGSGSNDSPGNTVDQLSLESLSQVDSASDAFRFSQQPTRSSTQRSLFGDRYNSDESPESEPNSGSESSNDTEN